MTSGPISAATNAACQDFFWGKEGIVLEKNVRILETEKLGMLTWPGDEPTG